MPDFKMIYTDIITEKFPEKMNDPLILNKLDTLDTAVDVLKFNLLVFEEPEYTILSKSQRLRSYDEPSILKILEYQSENKLTNTETGLHFRISRNTIARWKSFFKL